MKEQLSKSGLARRSAALGAGAALAVAGLPRTRARSEDATDVVVIGAGLSGLNAALLLEELGYSVQVIEGRQRVGGRLHTLRDIPGNPEAGGNGIGPHYGRMLDVLERLEVPYVNSAERRRLTTWDFYFDGERVSKKEWPTHPRNILPEQWKSFSPRQVPLVLLGRTNPLRDFEDWYDPSSAPHDISVYDVFKGQGFTDEQIQLTFNMNVPYGTSAHDISALMMWFNAGWSKAADDYPDTYISAIGGNMTIAEVMANALSKEVHLGKEVTGISSGASSAEVHCRDGSVYKAKRVVCSIPLPVLRHVRMDFQLPAVQRRALNLVPSFKVTQVHIVAKEPFWESDGLSPDMWTDTIAGHVIGNRHFLDDPQVSSLTTWARGAMAERLDRVSPEEGKAWVLSEIEKLRPAAKGKIEAKFIKSWQRDPFAGGAFAVWKPGQVVEYLSAVGQPYGRVHFCGEHTALSNRGMEGAMESGERAAFEVLEAL